jgi:hypothetical protein
LFSLYFGECLFNLDLFPADGIFGRQVQSQSVSLIACHAERLPLHPDAPRRAPREVARLLALGYLRLRARRQTEKVNDPNRLREFGLDFGAVGSVCDTDTHADRERR